MAKLSGYYQSIGYSSVLSLPPIFWWKKCSGKWGNKKKQKRQCLVFDCKRCIAKTETVGIGYRFLHTQYRRIASILFMEDTPLRKQHSKSYHDGSIMAAHRWRANTMPSKQTVPPITIVTIIPSITGGLTGATNMIYLLSHTDFAVSELAYQTVKS